MDHDIDALAEDVEVPVGDEHGDLDQRVVGEVEAGHLAVDPYQTVVHPGSLGARVSPRARERATASTQRTAQQIAAGYATEGAALELGCVVIDGVVDPTARVRIPFATLNRHGLVAGATGTGKTKTLQGLAEQLSHAGRPGAAGRRQG